METAERMAQGQPSSSGRPFEEALDPAAVTSEGLFQSDKAGSTVSSRTRLSLLRLGKGALVDGPSEPHQILSNEDPEGSMLTYYLFTSLWTLPDTGCLSEAPKIIDSLAA